MGAAVPGELVALLRLQCGSLAKRPDNSGKAPPTARAPAPTPASELKLSPENPVDRRQKRHDWPRTRTEKAVRPRPARKEGCRLRYPRAPHRQDRSRRIAVHRLPDGRGRK